tara:strand:- start:3026 stop:3853 length:828 start_codon:yes stop_codon:yes gene_type:complete
MGNKNSRNYSQLPHEDIDFSNTYNKDELKKQVKSVNNIKPKSTPTTIKQINNTPRQTHNTINQINSTYKQNHDTLAPISKVKGEPRYIRGKLNYDAMSDEEKEKYISRSKMMKEYHIKKTEIDKIRFIEGVLNSSPVYLYKISDVVEYIMENPREYAKHRALIMYKLNDKDLEHVPYVKKGFVKYYNSLDLKECCENKYGEEFLPDIIEQGKKNYRQHLDKRKSKSKKNNYSHNHSKKSSGSHHNYSTHYGNSNIFDMNTLTGITIANAAISSMC